MKQVNFQKRKLYMFILFPIFLFGQADILIWAPATTNTPAEIIERAQEKQLSLSLPAAKKMIESAASNRIGITSALCELGFSFDIVTDISTVNLNNYQAVFGALGDWPNNFVVPANSPQALAIDAYVNNGGKMYLEGGDCWYWDPQQAGGHDFGPAFGITGLADGNGTYFLIGSDIANGLDFDYLSGQGEYADYLAPTGAGVVIYMNDYPSFNCGIRNQSTGQTIGISFRFSDLLNGALSRTDLMAVFLGYFNITTGSGCSNQPPVTQISFSPPEIVWTDSVLADAAASYDPDGGALTFSWSASGSGPFPMINPFNNDSMAYVTPFHTGNIPITLSVSDGISITEQTKTFAVHPAIENMHLEYSYVDPDWERVLYYFHGDTLMVPVQFQNLIRVYDITDTGILPNTDIPLTRPISVQRFHNNQLWVINDGFSSPFFGPGSLSIYTVGNQWQLIPLLENYQPGSTDIADIQFIDTGVLIRDSFSLYLADFDTDPANPQIIAQRDYGFFQLRSVGQAQDVIYGIVRNAATNENSMHVFNKTTLDSIAVLQIAPDPQDFSIYDNLMFVGFDDSLNIYDITQPLAPNRLATITVPAPVPWITMYTSRPYRGKYISNNLLSVYKWGGLQLYDITTPSAPQPDASWYSGISGQANGSDILYHDSNYYVVSEFGGVQDTSNAYSGVNRVGLITGIAGSENSIPAKTFELFQNYPNPFNPTTTIRYTLFKRSKISLKIYNTLGQEVKTLVNTSKNSGTHTVRFDASALSSGIYFYRLTAEGLNITKKMLLIL